MSKAALISIKPKWCETIINGDKTIEVRKTRPKLDTPFKCYIYCTIGGQDLNIPISQERLMRDYLETGSMKSLNCPLGNGKVIGEFTCDRIYELETKARGGSYYVKGEDWLTACEVAQQSCLIQIEASHTLSRVASCCKIFSTYARPYSSPARRRKRHWRR